MEDKETRSRHIENAAVSAAEHTAVQIKAWATTTHALAFDGLEVPADQTPAPSAKLFRCIDVDHFERKLKECGITMIGVAPGDDRIVIATAKSLPARLAPTSTTTGIPLSFIKASRAGTGLLDTAVPWNANQGMISGHYTCGSSISPLTLNFSGTLGCLVRDSRDRLLGLSNNHVAGGCGFLAQRMPIIAPGLGDAQPGGLDAFVIGHHDNFAPWRTGLSAIVDVSQNLDIALFVIKDAAAVSSMQGNYFDTPTTIMTVAEVKQERFVRVRKVGRRTGLTRGSITARVTGNTAVAYAQPDFRSSVHYMDLICIEGSEGAPFALPGDSGSLVVADVRGENKALGIVFAVSTDASLTFVMPMEVVLDRLGIRLEGNHNASPTGGPGR